MTGTVVSASTMWRVFHSTVDMAVPGADVTVTLMGTHTHAEDVFIHPAGGWIATSIEPGLADKLLKRPEVVNHEPKAKAPSTQDR